MSRYLLTCTLLLLLLPGCSATADKSDSNTLAADPQHEEMMLRMAQATEQGGDLGAAERMYKGAATRHGSLQAHIELAAFYKRHHQDAAAAAVLEETLKLHPNNNDVKRDLANTYINMGQPESALPVLDSAIAADDKNAFLYNSRGVALDRLGRYREARKCYETALLLDPAEAMTFKTNLSMSFMLDNQPKEAVGILLPLLHAPDVTSTVRQNLAMAYGLEGRNDEALKLGLKDLSAAQAKENVEFYRMLAKNPPGRKQSAAPAPVAAEVFPEEESEKETDEQPAPKSVQTSMPVKPVAVKDVPAAAPSAGPATVKNDEAPLVEQQYSLSALPAPVLKPDR